MQNNIKQEAISTLSQLAKSNGFIKKGSAFFRINGDGVLQIIKPEYERSLPHYNLKIGLFSMYGTLNKEWFTSRGCIPQFSICTLNGQRGAVTAQVINDRLFFKIMSLKDQIELLFERGFQFFNSIETQAQLSEAILSLEEKAGTIRWNDSNKIAPNLRAGNYEMAKKATVAILQQHRLIVQGEIDRTAVISKDDLEFCNILDWINNNDRNSIHSFLSNNFSRNMQYASFLRGQADGDKGKTGDGTKPPKK